MSVGKAIPRLQAQTGASRAVHCNRLTGRNGQRIRSSLQVGESAAAA